MEKKFEIIIQKLVKLGSIIIIKIKSLIIKKILDIFKKHYDKPKTFGFNSHGESSFFIL